MGQILQSDRIGTISHSSGIISLAASVLTIGGQQYPTATLNRTIATDLSKIQTGTPGAAEAPIGSCFFSGGGSNAVYQGNTTATGNPANICMAGEQNGDVTNSYDDFGSTSGLALFATANLEFGGNFEVPISGWLNTPLKDL